MAKLAQQIRWYKVIQNAGLQAGLEWTPENDYL